MSGRNTHFEIFQRKHPNAEWVLMDAHPDRQKAINKARVFWGENRNSGVKIIKEARNEEKGEYDSVVVTTFGNCEDKQNKRNKPKPQTPAIACTGAEDLFKPEARKSYQEALPEFLQRHKVLPGELAFRPDLLSLLESSHGDLTQAIQRIAISRAGGEGLHATARELYEMTSQALDASYKERKAGISQKWDRPIGEIVKAARQSKRPIKSFSYALADRLKKSTNWRDKLGALLAVWEEVDTLDGRDRDFCNSVLTHYFTEWIETPNALTEMIGKTDNGVEVLDRLLAILEPEPKGFFSSNPIIDQPAALTMARAINLGVLPSARQRMISLIFESLSSGRRLYPQDLGTELEFIKTTGDRLIGLLGGKRHKEMYESFCNRSKTLMVTDTVEEYIATVERIKQPLKLLTFRDFLAGADARARLISFVRGIISQPSFENACLGQKSPVSTLSTLRATQIELLKSDFPEKDRLHGAQDVDKIGVRLIGQHNLLRIMAKKARSPEKAALALFRLAADALPHGQSASMAASAAIKLLQTEQAKSNLAGNVEMKAALSQMSQSARHASEIQIAG